MPVTFSYNKNEKLKSRKQLEDVFAKGKSVSVFPVKALYVEVKEELDFPIKVGVGASGKNFRKAVERNRVKRLLRESYRLNKTPLHSFCTEHKKQVAVFLLYVDKVLPTHELLQQKIPLLINKLIKALSENSTPNN
jgi:ribonuclease P protein component